MYLKYNLAGEIILKNDTEKLLVLEISVNFTNILAQKRHVNDKIKKFEFAELT